jgi:hypothetical protein
LEIRAVKYCEPERAGECEFQKRLCGDLERLSRKIESRIKAWQWLLRSDALAERAAAYARLAAVQASHV